MQHFRVSATTLPRTFRVGIATVGVLLPLGDDAIVHPGHGPDTTIGRERQTNPFILEYTRRS